MNRRFGLLLLFAALVASACAGGSSASEVEATSDQSTEANQQASSSDDTSSTAESAVDQGGTSMAASSPIGSFFADDGGFEAALEEYTIRVEEAIVICMAAEGFEFARSEAGRGNPVEDRQNELTVREWTSQYGFGISTSFDSIAQNQATDPNGEIVFGLSEAEREVWISTLTGGGFGDFDGDFSAKPLEEQGCIGQALIETGGQDAIEGLGDFGDIYEEGEAALFERREMVEVVTAWSRCMGEAGYAEYATLDDPEGEVEERLEAITAPLQAAISALSEEEGQALFAGDSFDVELLPGLDVDGLRELQADEIELALVDLDCYDAEVRETFEPLRDEFENGLLTEYSAEFDAIKNIGN